MHWRWRRTRRRSTSTPSSTSPTSWRWPRSSGRSACRGGRLDRGRRQWRTPWRLAAQGVRHVGGPGDGAGERRRPARGAGGPADRRRPPRGGDRSRGHDGGPGRGGALRVGARAPPGPGARVLAPRPAPPLVTPEAVEATLAALGDADGAIAAAPVADTIKEADADGTRRGALDPAGPRA